MGKRKDSKGRVLKSGESQHKNGGYDYRYTDWNGKRRSIYAATLDELRKKEDDIQKDLTDGIDSEAGMIIVTELAEKYLLLKQGLKPNTLRSYQRAVSTLKSDAFGSKRIKDVKRSDAKLWFVQLHNQGLKRNTISNIHSVLRPAFEMAVEDDAIRKNPFRFSLPELINNDAVERPALSKELQKEYIAFNEQYRDLGYVDDVIVLLNTGLRVSELYGLTKADVDFSLRRIYVRRQLCRKCGNELFVETPKSKQGYRCIPMTDAAYDALRRVMSGKRPQVERIIDGISGFIFLARTGRPKVSVDLENFMRQMLEKFSEQKGTNLPNITPHVLRHTFCTNMARAGMPPKELQYIMGHSKITMTLDVYTHTDYETTEREFLKAANGV